MIFIHFLIFYIVFFVGINHVERSVLSRVLQSKAVNIEHYHQVIFTFNTHLVEAHKNNFSLYILDKAWASKRSSISGIIIMLSPHIILLELLRRAPQPQADIIFIILFFTITIIGMIRSARFLILFRERLTGVTTKENIRR